MDLEPAGGLQDDLRAWRIIEAFGAGKRKPGQVFPSLTQLSTELSPELERQCAEAGAISRGAKVDDDDG
jgi:hypothetical protein